MSDAEKIAALQFLYVLFSNLALVVTIVTIYTRLIRRTLKMEYLVKRLCDKNGISTEVEL